MMLLFDDGDVVVRNPNEGKFKLTVRNLHATLQEEDLKPVCLMSEIVSHYILPACPCFTSSSTLHPIPFPLQIFSLLSFHCFRHHLIDTGYSIS
jgi:hypothetical protein